MGAAVSQGFLRSPWATARSPPFGGYLRPTKDVGKDHGVGYHLTAPLGLKLLQDHQPVFRHALDPVAHELPVVAERDVAKGRDATLEARSQNP